MRSAAILTGGQARRFGGCDKSALVVDGQTIFARQVAALSEVSLVGEILVVGREGRRDYRDYGGQGVEHRGEAEAGQRTGQQTSSRGPATRAIADLVPGSGPLGGIHAALTAMRGTAVFVAACDMPYLSAGLIEYLFEALRDADLVVPRTERGYHPLCAVYTPACLEPIARRLAERRLKVMDLANEVRTRVVTADELNWFGNRIHLLANVNTPADYAGLEALHVHKP
jgi:molybdopterin-guanine dinucleotide biosynthesis protein A